MNLRQNPTVDQLRPLIARCKDEEHHHTLWVGHDGEVRIDPLPEMLTPNGFERSRKAEMKFRLETFAAANGYTGPKACLDQWHLGMFFKNLMEHWTTGISDMSVT
jgi:hypothetical protein